MIVGHGRHGVGSAQVNTRSMSMQEERVSLGNIRVCLGSSVVCPGSTRVCLRMKGLRRRPLPSEKKETHTVSGRFPESQDQHLAWTGLCGMILLDRPIQNFRPQASTQRGRALVQAWSS
jgi:hypothetical protein